MRFLKDIQASVYGPEYYASLHDKPFSDSIKYFLTLIALLAIISTGVLLFSVIPAVHTFLASTSEGVVASYPDSLQIMIASGTASTNVSGTSILQLPASLQNIIVQPSVPSSSIQNLLVIDTKDPFTVNEFQNDQTLTLLTKNSLVYTKDWEDQSVVIQPIDASTSLTVDKADVVSWVADAVPYFKLLEWIIGIFMPIGIFIVLAFRLVYLFVLALLIWGLAEMSHVHVGYKKAYQWGLHLMTLPLVVTIFLWLIIPGVDIPFLFTVLALVMAAINLNSVRASHPVAPPPLS